MLEGIEILNKTEIMKPTIFVGILFVGLIVGIILLLVGVVSDFNVISILGGAISFICIILNATPLADEQPTGKYKYQVLIDETVSMTDFYEKYEVIDKEGQIWTIKEKENE